MLHRMTCGLCAAPAICGTLLLSGCLPNPDATPPPVNVASGLQAEYIVTSALHPSALAATQDGRVFYAEKETGAIRVIKNGTRLDTPFATVPVNYAGDRGLLGLAVHPRFVENGRVYAFYARSDTGLATDDERAIVDYRVVYFAGGAAGDVSSGGEVFVVSLPAGTGTTRISGRIAFAADRTLLVALGDSGDADAAQNPQSLFGKILRYNDDGTIPEDNPTADSPIFASGFRDVRGLTCDPQSEAIFATEQSLAGLHEINIVWGGKDYGWPQVVGLADTTAELAFAAVNTDYADPISESDRMVVGASFNPGTKYGDDIRQELFYGIADAGRVFHLELSAARTAAVAAASFAGRLPTPVTDVVFTPAGTLYVACEDAVLRINVAFP